MSFYTISLLRIYLFEIQCFQLIFSHWSMTVLKSYCVTVDEECNFEIMQENNAKVLLIKKCYLDKES